MKKFGKFVSSLLLAAGLAIPSPAIAQTSSPVQPDRIVIGSEFVPRGLDLPAVKVVAPGEIWEPPATASYDYIEVQDGGTLYVNRLRNTELSVTTLNILPGGYLNAGFVDPVLGNNCIQPDVRVTFTVKDTPIDYSKDPFQWGNGILVFGKLDICGAEKLTGTTLALDAAVGAQSIVLTDEPRGWRVGDEILLPDMRFQRREPTLTIASINGNAIGLSRALTFEHESVFRPDGVLVTKPYVRNLTRNVVVVSEGSTTPGHVAIIGANSQAHVLNAEFNNLGRTRNVALNNTSADLSHIGTNQIAKYSLHFHHVHEHGLGMVAKGNVLRGGVGKWGLVIHATHDTQVVDNTAIDFKGSGFVTEDGYETRNEIAGNFAAYMTGRAATATNPGPDGNGFWFRGRQNIIRDNIAINNAVGINDFGQNQVAGLFPSVPGGTPNTKFNRNTAIPIAFQRNTAVANKTGLELWGEPRYPNEDFVAANNSGTAVSQQILSPNHMYLVRPILVSQPGDNTIGISQNSAYSTDLEIRGGYIGGMRVGLSGNGGRERTVFDGITFQNITNIPFSAIPDTFEHTNVVHKPLGTRPPQYIVFGTTVVWDGVSLLPNPVRSPWVPQRGAHGVIKNWQGTGQDYQLFVHQQLESLPAWPSGLKDGQKSNVPEAGLTMLQAWNKYGMSFFGDVIRQSEIVPLEGLTVGYARAGLVTTFGPPQAVVTTPSSLYNAAQLITVVNGKAQIRGLITLTGDDSRFHGVRARIDGGVWVKPTKSTGAPDDVLYLYLSGALLSVGNHIIETVRVDEVTGEWTTPKTYTYTIQ